MLFHQFIVIKYENSQRTEIKTYKPTFLEILLHLINLLEKRFRVDFDPIEAGLILIIQPQFIQLDLVKIFSKYIRILPIARITYNIINESHETDSSTIYIVLFIDQLRYRIRSIEKSRIHLSLPDISHKIFDPVTSNILKIRTLVNLVRFSLHLIKYIESIGFIVYNTISSCSRLF